MTLVMVGGLLCGCDGKFVGPPGGGTGGTIGGTPIIGASPFTFEPEVEGVNDGLATDVWFFNPGVDTNDVLTPPKVRDGDGLDLLRNCGFEGFLTDNFLSSAPGSPEINVQFPIAISLVCQWFLRNPDGSRITSLDIFGNPQPSSSSLDFSAVSAPVADGFNQQGILISRLVNTQLYPAGGTTTITLPMLGWSTPPGNDPTVFPAPQQLFINRQFNSLDVISVLLTAADPGALTGLGGSIEDENNENVEHLGSAPQLTQTGQLAQPIFLSTGLFQDLYANAYLNSPVRQPKDSAVKQPQSLDDPLFEQALVEVSRHEGAVMAWLILEAVGISTVKSDGSLADGQIPFWQNGYQYRISNEDISDLSSKVVGPLDDQDPTKNIGLLPGVNR